MLLGVGRKMYTDYEVLCKVVFSILAVSRVTQMTQTGCRTDKHSSV
jgi:hypothetical protein